MTYRWNGIKLTTGLLALFVGGMLYLLFRTRALLMFGVADAVGLGGSIDGWRALVAGSVPPEFVVYSLPCGLWAASYVLLIDVLASRWSPKVRLAIASIVPLSGAVSELLQGLRLLPGTFDVVDAACYLVPLAVYAAYLYTK